VVDGQESLQKLFSSPAFTPAAKKAVIESSLRSWTPADHDAVPVAPGRDRRIRNFSDVQQAFEELLADRQNRARLGSRRRLSLPAELGDIKKKLEAVTGKQVEIDAKVDPAVIGGARPRSQRHLRRTSEPAWQDAREAGEIETSRQQTDRQLNCIAHRA